MRLRRPVPPAAEATYRLDDGPTPTRETVARPGRLSCGRRDRDGECHVDLPHTRGADGADKAANSHAAILPTRQAIAAMLAARAIVNYGVLLVKGNEGTCVMARLFLDAFINHFLHHLRTGECLTFGISQLLVACVLREVRNLPLCSACGVSPPFLPEGEVLWITATQTRVALRPFCGDR